MEKGAASISYASSTALETAVEVGGTRQLTLAAAATTGAGDDYLVVWTDGTNGHVGFLNTTSAGASTFTAGADTTYTELASLTGVTSVDALASANFLFVA